MAIGKEIGEFSYKATSVTYGVQNVQANLDGTATGFGRVQGTLTIQISEPGAKSGTCSAIFTAYLDDGSIIGATFQGTWENAGKHKWRLHGINHTTDGRSFASDGEIDLATDSVTGKIYEWS